MADEKDETVVEEKLAQEEAEGFAEGYEQGPNDEPAKGETETEETKVEEPPPPEYVQVTKEDFDRLNAAVAKVASLEGAVSKIAGNAGNLQKAIEKLKADTPAGAAVEITDADFAELLEDFPDLARHTKTAMERILKRTGARGTAESDIGKAVEQALARREMDEFVHRHPDWETVVGRNLDDEARKANPFRKWLALQPQQYQDTINSTQSPSVTASAIDKFKADHQAALKAAAQPKLKAVPRIAARQDRLVAAVQPKGAGGKPPGPAQKTEQDEFEQGFASG